ncbi:hypothetical protein C4K15_5816 [Pseudomonas chlororaphis subsp. aurantiaca]|nr:hypothetical protein C4K15_5816 [Pseudomonas chlororaphis subsp. aurantiaca]
MRWYDRRCPVKCLWTPRKGAFTTWPGAERQMLARTTGRRL